MRTGRKPTIQVNSGYFNDIDNESKAYWLGYIYADGHVARKAPWVVVIQTKDIEHLQLFADEIEYTGEVKIVNGSGYNTEARHGRLVICRKEMCDALNSLGRNEQFMEMPRIPRELVRHFIRGYFDGDGSIFAASSNHKVANGRKKYSYLQTQIIGEEWFLNEIAKYFSQESITSTMKDSKTDYMKYLRVHGGNNLRKMHEYLYGDSTISLKRKADKWQPLYCPVGERSLIENPEYAGNS